MFKIFKAMIDGVKAIQPQGLRWAIYSMWAWCATSYALVFVEWEWKQILWFVWGAVNILWAWCLIERKIKEDKRQLEEEGREQGWW